MKGIEVEPGDVKKRTTDAKLKRAAKLVKEEGVRVRLGEYVIEPATDQKHEKTIEGEELQRRLEAMGRR